VGASPTKVQNIDDSKSSGGFLPVKQQENFEVGATDLVTLLPSEITDLVNHDISKEDMRVELEVVQKQG
jgi:hypothetical protein